ncbi:MAG: hypothetical protein FD189_1682 [Elusimicrobia bacterium]|nr:MAG: hypothetical protein FD154_1848 [Elusimicrobiota bacterium]KAF0154802.1 MAG: hypothetical protein FD189_1682 [Elusimicrobiota bacterium]
MTLKVGELCRDIDRFLRGLSKDLPGLFTVPRPRPPHRRGTPCRRVSPYRSKPCRSDVARARVLLTARADHWSLELGIPYKRIAIRSQRTRWGSCSAKGNLNFNWRLAAAPSAVLDYVVVHELCHLRELNHSRDFWAHVRAACPDYKSHRRWLRENTAALMSVAAL